MTTNDVTGACEQLVIVVYLFEYCRALRCRALHSSIKANVSCVSMLHTFAVSGISGTDQFEVRLIGPPPRSTLS